MDGGGEMGKPEFDNRVFLSFTAAGLLLGAGGLMLSGTVGLSDCRGIGARGGGRKGIVKAFGGRCSSVGADPFRRMRLTAA